MHSLGYLWEIGLHDVTMNRRPYIPNLLDSQPQSALAPEASAIISRSIDIDLISEGDHRSADVATKSHGDFHERSLESDHRSDPAKIEDLLERIIATSPTRRRDTGASGLGCKGSLAFS